MKVHFKSKYRQFERDLEKSERQSREHAAKYLAKKLQEEVMRLFGAGNLYAGAGAIERLRYVTRVGFKRPAYHAHLIEYGTDERFVQNYRGKTDKKVSVGEMDENPFFQNLLDREEDDVGRIMGEMFVRDFM